MFVWFLYVYTFMTCINTFLSIFFSSAISFFLPFWKNLDPCLFEYGNESENWLRSQRNNAGLEKKTINIETFEGYKIWQINMNA